MVKKKIQRIEVDDTDVGDITSPTELFDRAEDDRPAPLLLHVERLRTSSSFVKGFLTGVALMSTLFALAVLLILRSLT